MNDKNDIRILDNWKSVSYRPYDAYVCIPQFGTKRADVNKLTYLINNGIPTNLAKDMIFNIVEDTNIKGRAISFKQLNGFYTLNDNVIQVSDIINRMEILSGHMNSQIEVRKADNYIYIPDYFELEALAKANELLFMDWIHVKRRTNATKNDIHAFFLDINVFQNFPIRTPNSVLIANEVGKQHGRGDFIVSSGHPYMQHATVINGLDFPRMFSMSSFKGLYTNEELEKLRKLNKPMTLCAKGKYKGDKIIIKKEYNK